MLKCMKEDYSHLFKILESIVPMNDELREVTEKNFFWKKFPKGYRLLEPGKLSNKMYFIIKGLIRIYTISGDKEICRQFFFENSFASDYVSFISHSPSNYFLETLEDTECLVVQNVDLNRLYEIYPCLLKVGKLMAEHAFIFNALRSDSMVKDDALTRYNKLIYERPKVLQRVPLFMIASYLGLTPEGLSRVRKKVTLA